MSGNQIVHTICVSSDDATRLDEESAVYRWEIPGDCKRYRATRIQLGSIEMNLPQWNVEERWSKLHFMECLRFPVEDRSLEFWVQPSSGREEASVAYASVPADMNPIVSWKRARGDEGEVWVATTLHPHGLRGANGASLLRHVTWGVVRVVASPIGTFDVDVSSVDVPEDDELRFRSFPGEGVRPSSSMSNETNTNRCGALHVPWPKDPSDACRFFTTAFRGAPHGFSVFMRYEPDRNRVSCTLLSTTGEPLRVWSDPGTNRSVCQILGLCGLSCPMDAEVRGEGVDVPCEPLTAAWASASLRPGVYVPSNRPMTTGQPLRFSTEVHRALRRLYLDPPDRISEGEMTASYLVFQGPDRVVRTVPLPCGRHAPDAICEGLSEDITSELGGKAYVRVRFDGERYTFRCASEDGHPRLLSLLFSSDASVDPSHFGFHAVDLCGSSEYTSSFAVPFPDCSCGHGPTRAPLSAYAIEEVGATQTLTVSSSPSRSATALVIGYDRKHNAVCLRTYVAILPSVHGYLPGDVLEVSPLSGSGTSLLTRDEGDGPSSSSWKQTQVPSCDLEREACGYVVDLPPPPSNGSRLLTLCTLWLRVRASSSLSKCVGSAVSLSGTTLPSVNWYCGPTVGKSLRPSMMGFSKAGAVLQSARGSVHGADGRRFGPVCTSFHDMDNPDYMLIYLEDAKRGTLLHHTHQGVVSTPFAKMVLTPLFRDERMLPKDTAIASAECLTHFTLRFANPDGTPYQWHGSSFTVSMNLVRTSEP